MRNVNLRKRSALRLVLAAAALSSLAEAEIQNGGPITPLQSKYDAVYYDLNLKVDPETQYIEGFVDIHGGATEGSIDTVELDLIDVYTIDSLFVNGHNAEHRHLDHKLYVFPRVRIEKGEQFMVRVHYSGKPPVAQRPPWSGGFSWEKDEHGKPWIGVSCQHEGAKIWWPCKDHPSDEPDSIGINITVPEGLICAANGVLEKTTLNGDGWNTFHWKTRYPINNYLVNINIADYAVVRRERTADRPFDLVFYVLKEDSAGANGLLDQAEEMARFYADAFGPFPFADEKLGLAQTSYWGMEHQTIIAYGNKYKNTELGYDFLLLHEMGHEWWGNLLSAGDWADFWLHEGTGTYAEAMWIEEKYGYQEMLKFFPAKARKRIQNKSPIVPKRQATTKESYNIDVYFKGAYMLHTLRFLIGKETLNSVLKEFITSPEYIWHNHPTTEDFIELTETRSGTNLRWFFDRYLYNADLPVLDVDKRKIINGIKLEIEWETSEFRMPVEVEVVTAAGNYRDTLNVSNEELAMVIPDAEEVVIDPDGRTLFEKKEDVFAKYNIIWFLVILTGFLTIDFIIPLG